MEEPALREALRKTAKEWNEKAWWLKRQQGSDFAHVEAAVYQQCATRLETVLDQLAIEVGQ